MTHLEFRGQCEEAFRFYAQCLDGKIRMLLTYEEAGAPHTPEQSRKILHATLEVGDGRLTGVDLSNDQYEAPRGFSVQLNLTELSRAEGIFAAFAEGGVVRLPMQPTFWALGYGLVTDRFGTPWEINCGTHD